LDGAGVAAVGVGCGGGEEGGGVREGEKGLPPSEAEGLPP
jgi:hypothetical protein